MPILTLARASPIVRTNSDMWAFSWAKGCSTRLRILDCGGIAVSGMRGHRFAARFFAVDLADKIVLLQKSFVGLGTVGGNRPDLSHRLCWKCWTCRAGRGGACGLHKRRRR